MSTATRPRFVEPPPLSVARPRIIPPPVVVMPEQAPTRVRKSADWRKILFWPIAVIAGAILLSALLFFAVFAAMAAKAALDRKSDEATWDKAVEAAAEPFWFDEYGRYHKGERPKQ